MTDPEAHKNHLLTISVVTPSFNQAVFLKRCLDSVAVQTYPALEHLVYDPGSTDGSIKILDKYTGVTLFNEPDNGQADAVSKGIERSRGDIIAWVNSDDAYSNPDVFSKIVARFQQEDQPDIVYGKGIYTDANFNELKDAYINTNPETLSDRLQYGVSILQPAVFIKRDVFSKIGLLRTHRHFTMDYDLWIRAVKAGLSFAYLDEDLAFASYYPDNKTFSRRGESYLEICDLMKEHFGYVHEYWLSRYAEFLVDGHDGVIRYQTVKQRPNPEAFAEQFRTLMVAFNGDILTRNHPERQSNPNINQTLEKLESLESVASERCIQIPDGQRAPEGYVSYRVGTR